jgi:PAP2 superfamily
MKKISSACRSRSSAHTFSLPLVTFLCAFCAVSFTTGQTEPAGTLNYSVETVYEVKQDPSLLKALREPPKPGSAEELTEFYEISDLQHPYRAPDECRRKDLEKAKLEAINIGPELFLGFLEQSLQTKGTTLTSRQLAGTLKLLKKTWQDFSAVATELKSVYPRIRPGRPEEVQRVAKEGISITNFVTVPTTSSFPSGHASIGHGMALVLSLLDPDGTEFYLEEGWEIGQHREILGVHFPSDVRAGQRVSDWIFDRMWTNSDFQGDLLIGSNEVYQIRHGVKRAK